MVTSRMVEVVGVFRAVRVGSKAFTGNDAKVMSAFCGQLAFTMVAERVVAEICAKASAVEEM